MCTDVTKCIMIHKHFFLLVIGLNITMPPPITIYEENVTLTLCIGVYGISAREIDFILIKRAAPYPLEDLGE